jgi:hypothetical protein
MLHGTARKNTQPTAPSQLLGKLDGKGDFGIGDRNRLLRAPCLLEIAIDLRHTLLREISAYSVAEAERRLIPPSSHVMSIWS